MKCPHCAKEIAKTNVFYCPYCGKQITAAPPISIQTAHVQAKVVQPQRRELRIGNYRAIGLWRSGSTIYWVVPADKSSDVSVARNLAIQMPHALNNDLLTKIRALSESGPYLARVLGQTNDGQRRWYLIVDRVEGVPLDSFFGKMESSRATKVFEKILQSMIYLHDEGWVIAKPKRQSIDADLWDWIQVRLGWKGNSPSDLKEEDPARRFQYAFALATNDDPILFDYTLWEPILSLLGEHDERIQRDMRWTVTLLDKLITGGHPTKNLEKLKQAPSNINHFIINVLREAYPTFHELGETFNQVMGTRDFGKTIPLPTLAPSATTKRLPITKLSSTAMTDPGKVRREHNEDNCFAQPMGAAGGIFVVADGMGGHSAGEVASKMAIDEVYRGAVAQWAAVESSIIPDNVHQMFEVWIKNANAKILAEAQARSNNMGTTLTAALVVNGMVYAANVGDSRTYLFRSGQLYPLTRDHSLVASLVQAGILRPDEVYTHPQRNEIFRALGQQKDVSVDIFPPQALGHEDRLVLCSDGLWEMVRPPQFEEILKKNIDPEKTCAELIKAANENGGEDNITVVIVRVTFE